MAHEDDTDLPTPFPMTLGDPDDIDGLGDQPVDDGEGGEDSLEAQLEALRRQVADGQAGTKAMQDLYAQTLARSNASQPQGKPVEPPAAPSFDDLPDPVQDPEAFRTELGTRINKTLAHNAQQLTTKLTSEQQRAANADRLMTRFSERHADLAGRQALLYGVVAQEANRLRQQGVIDPVSYAIANEETFLDSVAEKMRAELGESAVNGSKHSKGKAPGKTQQRTAGVSSGAPASGGKAPAPKPTGFNDQLLKTQQANGLI